MWNYEWSSVVGTLLLILIHTCGCAKQQRSRNTQRITEKDFHQNGADEELLVTQENIDLLREDRDSAIPRYRSEYGMHRGTAHSQITTGMTGAAATRPGNYPEPADAILQRRNADPGNSLHRLYSAGKLGGGGRSSTLENYERSGSRQREEECCVRRPNVISVGYDAFGKKKLLDVGKCRRIVKSVVAHLALLDSDPDQRLELMDMITRSQTQCSACGSGDSCSARQSRLDRINLRGGFREVAVIEECSCTPKPSQCQRLPQYQTLYPNSPYETTVDIGMCLGHCKSDDGTETQCRPTRTRTVSVEGPMGAHCIDVIESCECSQECYRTSYVEAFYAFEWNETLNRTQQVVKKIDVGRCAGGCQSSPSVKCLMGSGQNPGSCLMGLYGQTSCSPRSYTSHELAQRDGERFAVLSIDSCRCQ